MGQHGHDLGTILNALLLLSGGMDSTALAALQRPIGALFIDYGQRSAPGERLAAAAVGSALEVTVHSLRIDCSPVGAGLLVGDERPPYAPSPEWWPYRNQLLVTLAASWGLPRGFQSIVIGSVRGDGERHLDGTQGFYESLDRLVSMQEGGMNVVAPALGVTTADLVNESGISDQVLVMTHSCDVSPIACGFCPSCEKRRITLGELGRLQ